MFRKLFVVAFVFFFFLVCVLSVSAQTQDPAKWPLCRLGAAPIAPGPAPSDAVVFKSTGGPVVMSEAGPNGSVRLIRCRLAADTLSYRSKDGDLRDVASNQPYWPIGWDAAPTPIADAIRNIKGDTGPTGPKGDQGSQGEKGEIGEAGPEGLQGPIGKSGNSFHCGKKCKWTLAAIAGGTAYGTWYYWYCLLPPQAR